MANKSINALGISHQTYAGGGSHGQHTPAYAGSQCYRVRITGFLQVITEKLQIGQSQHHAGGGWQAQKIVKASRRNNGQYGVFVFITCYISDVIPGREPELFPNQCLYAIKAFAVFT
jgi:hypothetical protein